MKVSDKSMLKVISSTLNIKKRVPFEIEISSDLRDKVQVFWNDFIQGKDGYWDGDLLSVTNYSEEDHTIEVGKAKFSWLIYAKSHPGIDAHSLFVAILFQTLDGYYVITKNNHQQLNMLGGIVEDEDIVTGTFHPDICLRRELKEELQLDLYAKEHVLTYQMKYLKVPESKGNYGVLYTGVLNFTKEEFKNYFIQGKKNFDHEITDIFLLTKEEVNKLKLNEDISYLYKLVEEE